VLAEAHFDRRRGMKTVILCGGFGTRIRDVADDIPKPMIPVGGVPILWHIMKYYALFGHRQFVLCLGYKGRVIKDFFLNYDAFVSDFTIKTGRGRGIEFHGDHQEMDWEVTMAETGVKAYTGARVKRVKKYVGADDNFFLTYGDGVGDIDLEKLLAFHKGHGKILTVSGVRPPGRFGELEYDQSGRVTGFNEKPQVSAGRISAGFFVCRKEIFEYLDDREELVFEQEPMRRLVADNQLMMYPHDGFWHPMDTYRDYSYLNGLVENREAPWMLWSKKS
jgi:glucose-1-phosphate cytidylyltransferase